MFTYIELLKMFNEYLDTNNNNVIINNRLYSPSYTLESVDPTAYRHLLTDWLTHEGYEELFNNLWGKKNERHII
jgi:hypothetical protein